jgi:hypothetical protein
MALHAEEPDDFTQAFEFLKLMAELGLRTQYQGLT